VIMSPTELRDQNRRRGKRELKLQKPRRGALKIVKLGTAKGISMSLFNALKGLGLWPIDLEVLGVMALGNCAIHAALLGANICNQETMMDAEDPHSHQYHAVKEDIRRHRLLVRKMIMEWSYQEWLERVPWESRELPSKTGKVSSKTVMENDLKEDSMWLDQSVFYPLSEYCDVGFIIVYATQSHLDSFHPRFIHRRGRPYAIIQFRAPNHFEVIHSFGTKQTLFEADSSVVQAFLKMPIHLANVGEDLELKAYEDEQKKNNAAE